jgi:hypothetical protein
MPHGHDNTKNLLEAAAGTGAELAKQSGLMQTQLGQNIYHAATRSGAGQYGAMATRAVVAATPVVVASTVAAAPFVIAASVVGGVTYVGYRFVKWLCD